MLDGVEGPHPQEVLLEGADEAFGAAITLRRADEGGRALDAEELQLVLERVGHVLAGVVMAEGEACRDALGEAAEVLADTLPEGFQRFEAGAASGGMEADALGIVVVDGDEHCGLTLSGPGGGHVGAPHGVQRSGMMVPSWLVSVR